ncbi:MAG: AMP-binding protein [Aliidongia sp.]
MAEPTFHWTQPIRAERLAYVLSDAQPLVVLTQERLQGELPPYPSHVVIIDADVSSVAPPECAPPPDRARSAHNLAYVIYTSGSTGVPKGVEIEHYAVASMLESMQGRPGFSADDTMLALTTPAFDISVLEVFLPLVSAGGSSSRIQKRLATATRSGVLSNRRERTSCKRRLLL